MFPLRHSTLSALAALTLLAAAPAAFAHGAHVPVHGGQLTMAEEAQFELVKTAKGVDVYVVDDEEDIVASNFTAKLTVTTGGVKKDTAMKVVKGNQFTAPGLKIAPGSKVVVTLVNTATGVRVFATYNAVK